MRVSKKFVATGKHDKRVFQPCLQTPMVVDEMARAVAEIDYLERLFHEKDEAKGLEKHIRSNWGDSTNDGDAPSAVQTMSYAQPSFKRTPGTGCEDEHPSKRVVIVSSDDEDFDQDDDPLENEGEDQGASSTQFCNSIAVLL